MKKTVTIKKEGLLASHLKKVSRSSKKTKRNPSLGRRKSQRRFNGTNLTQLTKKSFKITLPTRSRGKSSTDKERDNK